MTSAPLADDVEQLLLWMSEALTQAGIPFAFGGAIALAYCTRQPRGTTDLDVNVFTTAGDARRVFTVLESAVPWTREDLERVEREEQVRLWSTTGYAVDLFFSYADFHAVASRRARRVPFAGQQIPILDCTDLAVFKAMFDRTKDWADIEEALATGSVDVRRLRTWITRMVGSEDPRHAMVDRSISRAEEERRLSEQGADER